MLPGGGEDALGGDERFGFPGSSRGQFSSSSVWRGVRRGTRSRLTPRVRHCGLLVLLVSDTIVHPLPLHHLLCCHALLDGMPPPCRFPRRCHSD